MTTITIAIEDELAQILQATLYRKSITAEELVKQALYLYLDEEQTAAHEQAEDSLVGLFDLGDPLLSEKSEEILQAIFTENTVAVQS